MINTSYNCRTTTTGELQQLWDANGLELASLNWNCHEEHIPLGQMHETFCCTLKRRLCSDPETGIPIARMVFQTYVPGVPHKRPIRYLEMVRIGSDVHVAIPSVLIGELNAPL
jgi:hypothetical protein